MITPTYILKDYAFEALNANLETFSDINGIVPVLPIEDNPLVTDSGKPYIIYGFVEDPNTDLFEIRGGVMVMRVLSDKFTVTTDVVTVLQRLFEEQDFSAVQVNRWASAKSYSDPAYADYRQIRFTRTFIQYADGGNPPDREGGKVEGIVNIRYEYVVHKDIKRFNGAAWV